jgi:hypothetical protein
LHTLLFLPQPFQPFHHALDQIKRFFQLLHILPAPLCRVGEVFVVYHGLVADKAQVETVALGFDFLSGVIFSRFFGSSIS